MEKRVSELSFEEFKKTFPIILKEHNPDYRVWYEQEKEVIVNTVKADDIARISHIGSTVIDGLTAKPTIDILLEVDGCCNISELLGELKKIGYGEEIFSRSDDPMRLLLGKGYSLDGYAEKVFHLHVRYMGNWDELYFRDYLIANPDVAAEYGNLKVDILKDIESGLIERIQNGKRNGYSQAKLSFVEKYSKLAKEEYCNRYKPGV